LPGLARSAMTNQKPLSWPSSTKLINRLEKAEMDAARIDFLETNPDKRLSKNKRHWQCIGFTNYGYSELPVDELGA